MAFDHALRELTHQVADAARAMIAAQETPPPVYEKQKCSACSLLDICRPKQVTKSGAAWLARRIAEI